MRMGGKATSPASVYLLLFFTLFAFLFGCEERRPAGEVVVGLDGTLSTLDPRLAIGARAERISPLIYSSLLELNERGELVPDLAEEWRQLNPTTYLFRIKRGVHFHDGRKLTAYDVKATFDFILDPKNASPKRGSFEPLERIQVPDRCTVIFTLKKVYVPFPFTLTVGIVPAGSPPGRKSPPPGSGPYRLQEWRPGERIVLVPFEDYFGTRPRIRRIVFRIVPNTTTRLLEMKRGRIDLLQNCVPAYAIRFMERIPSLQVLRSPGTTYQYIGYNLEDPILRVKDVRKAISYAIDRDAIIEHTLKGLARKAYGIVLSPLNWAYTDRLPHYEYDPSRAKRLLDRAGFPDPDGDGPAFRFALSFKTSTDAESLEIAQIIREHLRQVGIKLEVRSFEWGTFFEDIKRGNFQLYSLRWIGVTDPDILYYLFHSSMIPPYGANRGRYRNEEVDRLLEEARSCLDREKRKELYERIQRILAEDVVYTSLWYRDNLVVMRRRLKGFRIYPGGQYTSLKEAWVEG